MTEREAALDELVVALVAGAELGLPADVQELLVNGDPVRGIPAGILKKMLTAASAFRTKQ